MPAGRPSSGARAAFSLLADREQERARDDEADRVDEDRVRGRHERISPPASPGRRPARPRRVTCELRVAVDEVLALDERGEVRLVGDVEEDGEDPDQERRPRTAARSSGRPSAHSDRDEHEQQRARRRRRRSGSRGGAAGRPRRRRAARRGGTAGSSTMPRAANSERRSRAGSTIATSGSASCETCEPNSLIVWPSTASGSRGGARARSRRLYASSASAVQMPAVASTACRRRVSAARKSSISFFARCSKPVACPASVKPRADEAEARSRAARARPRSRLGGACRQRSPGRLRDPRSGRGRAAPCGRRTSPSSRAPCACGRRGSGPPSRAP